MVGLMGGGVWDRGHGVKEERGGREGMWGISLYVECVVSYFLCSSTLSLLSH